MGVERENLKVKLVKLLLQPHSIENSVFNHLIINSVFLGVYAGILIMPVTLSVLLGRQQFSAVIPQKEVPTLLQILTLLVSFPCGNLAVLSLLNVIELVN